MNQKTIVNLIDICVEISVSDMIVLVDVDRCSPYAPHVYLGTSDELAFEPGDKGNDITLELFFELLKYSFNIVFTKDNGSFVFMPLHTPVWYATGSGIGRKVVDMVVEDEYVILLKTVD